MHYDRSLATLGICPVALADRARTTITTSCGKLNDGPKGIESQGVTRRERRRGTGPQDQEEGGKGRGRSQEEARQAKEPRQDGQGSPAQGLLGRVQPVDEAGG